MLFFRFLAAIMALGVVTAELPVLEFSANLLLRYNNETNPSEYTGASCKSGGCENAIHELLQPWQEWAMEQMEHSSDDYSCDKFDDYDGEEEGNEACPHYPAFEGDKVLRYCSRCAFTNTDYDGIVDVSQLINTTILKWTQAHTIDTVRTVLNPVNEKLQGCPCLGLKYKFMVDYYVTEREQRRRNRKYMRV